MTVKWPRVNPTIRHLMEAPCPHRTAPRLYTEFSPITFTVDYDALGEVLGMFSDQGTLFFPDTCFLNGPEISDSLWDRILSRRLVISDYIWREIQEWVHDPRRNKRVAEAIRNAHSGAKNGVYLDYHIPTHEWWYLCKLYYVTLLGYRKSRVRDLIDTFFKQHRRNPDDTEFDRLCKTNSLPKDLKLLTKGYQDLCRGSHFFSDEDLIVSAGIAALCTGYDAVILSRDRDVLEQFAKFTYLLTVHYFGLLFAERYADEPHNFNIRSLPANVPTIDAYFDRRESFLVRKPVEDPDYFVSWLLPREYKHVTITCILLGGQQPNLTLSFIRYTAEHDMNRLIATKGRTRGFSTDKLDGKNCHVTGFPVGVPDPRNHVIIAKDRVRHAQGDPMSFAFLDIDHTIHHHPVLSKPILPT